MGCPPTSFWAQQTGQPNVAWASFDGTTNPPELYPNGNSFSNLLVQLQVVVSPTSLADGTNGVPYPPVTLVMNLGAAFYPAF